VYAQECATCEFWETDEQDEYCTFEMCIHFPEVEREQPEEEQEVVEEE